MLTSRALALFLTSLFLAPVAAAPPETKPVAGLRNHTPNVHALVGGTIIVMPGQVVANATLVIRDGVITAVGKNVSPPADARIWDVSGKTLYPGFIDPYSQTTVKDGPPRSSTAYWNPQVTPERSLARLRHHNADADKKRISQGITARLVAPNSGIIQGTSAVVLVGINNPVRALVRDDIAQHLRLTIPRRDDREKFPNSPMGAVTLARQAFYDAKWYSSAQAILAGDATLPPIEKNDALQSLQKYPGSGRLLIIDAPDERFALRADRFAREFALTIALRGSGREYRRLAEIQQTGRSMIIPVNFPKAPNVSTPEAARGVTLETAMHWDHAPENPARLSAAGVNISLTSHGLKDTGKFLAQVRTAIKRGLPADVALQALTTNPAKLLGVEDRLGSLQVGRLANILVVSGDLLAEETAKLEAVWVAGERQQPKKEETLDITGRWNITVGNAGKLRFKLNAQLTEKDEKLAGTVQQISKAKKVSEIPLQHIALKDAYLSATFDAQKLGHEGIARLSAIVEIDEKSASWNGRVIWPDGQSLLLLASRQAPTPKAEPNKGKPNDKEQEEKPSPKLAAASHPVNFPLGAFGRSNMPTLSKNILFKNATIWTCSKAGILEKTSVLVANGKIAAIGKRLDTPAGTLVVDLAGKHLTPGIIDCHSHMATDGGVNESSQAITAEVRIGDFIDPTDITIYRQLGGGVTCSNILHGSANSIGGQNQVIKLRWGATGEQLKFRLAPAGIKFALGENVKQSNWGDKYTSRYPQTRMGVQQIIRDEFAAARDYTRRHQQWKKTRKGLPPRRDLELDAIAEILAGKRWIHCHSYRQDEILALMRTLEAYNVRIGTFQHILEGYKVAEVMAQHGAMGSAFSDWWAYKFEVYDAIPYNGALMHKAGVVVSFNSDDRELARHLNQEAAKAVKYGGVSRTEALKFVTLNPARQLRIDKYVGSVEVGKQADFAIWSGDPLSNFTRCEQTWIEGRKYFDRDDDEQLRKRASEMRATLVQKILASGTEMLKPGEKSSAETSLWPRTDVFCRTHQKNHRRGER